MSGWLLAALAVALVLGTAVLVAAEFALVALDRAGVQRAVDEGDAAARPVLGSLQALPRRLATARVGITTATVALGALVSLAVDPRAAALLWVGALVAVLLVAMVIGELVPQILGISAPLPTAKAASRSVQVVGWLLLPWTLLLQGIARGVLAILRVSPTEVPSARTPMELASVVRRSALAGSLDERVARRVTRSLRFGDRTAQDIMSPRVRCVAVERTSSAAELVTLAASTGHSRFPVIGDDWDDVAGLVHVKSAIAVPRGRRGRVPVSALMTTPTLVPQTLGLDPLLLLLRGAGHQMAVVVDEYGGTSGVVTLEDVVEELVGEVSDEHDRAVPVGRRVRDGSWLVPGLWRPDEARDRLRVPVPDGAPYETVGGFVMALLGRVPVVGDQVEVAGWLLRVETVDGRRVERLRVLPPELAGHRPAATIRVTGRSVPAGRTVSWVPATTRRDPTDDRGSDSGVAPVARR